MSNLRTRCLTLEMTFEDSLETLEDEVSWDFCEPEALRRMDARCMMERLKRYVLLVEEALEMKTLTACFE